MRKQILGLALAVFAAKSGVAIEASKRFNSDHGLALHGYDAVSYFSPTGPVEGKGSFQTKVDGQDYRFASAENLAEFKKSPARYQPLYGGWCAYAMADGDLVDVNPKTFKIVDGKLLLFYNGWLGNTLTKWNKDEANLRTKADANWAKP